MDFRRDDALKFLNFEKTQGQANDEEGFRKACEFVLLHSPTGGNLEAEVKRRDLIQEAVAHRESTRPMLHPQLWEQRQHYASSLGRFCQSCERGGLHHSARRMGTGVHFIDESDGVPAAGKTKTKYERSKMGQLEGTVAKEGESRGYKRADGHSSGAPCQDHYFYERGNAAVEVEMPLGKRMRNMLFFLGNVGAHEGSAEAPNVTVVTATTMLLLAGAGFLKQSNTCRRRKTPDDTPEKWPNTADFQRVVSESDVVDDAEKCWTIGYGSCKYTGLRPDALDLSKGPPEPLSIEEADWLQVPELREGEADKLEELRQKVVDIREQHRHRVDNCTLLRFLRAEKGKVHRAEKKLREAISWMEENDVANVFKTWNLKAYEQCLAPWWLSGGFLGHGLQGEPVALERLGRCSWPKLCNRLDFEVLKKLDIVHCRRSLAALEEDSMRRGVPFSGVTLIIDLKGFKWSDAQFGCARDFDAGRGPLLLQPPGLKMPAPACPARSMAPAAAGALSMLGAAPAFVDKRHYDNTSMMVVASEVVLPGYRHQLCGFTVPCWFCQLSESTE
ncbi:retm [Symbiodinium sp. KB8]|nr:retm [Symbiodinium sp. KB8]